MLLLRRLDKGHLAYINFVRMEHWYNNPVLNGFCEMMIESMLYSQIYKKKLELAAMSTITISLIDDETTNRPVVHSIRQSSVNNHHQNRSMYHVITNIVGKKNNLLFNL